MNKMLLGFNTAFVSRQALALFCACACCVSGTAAADFAALDKAAYNNPNGDTHVVCLADASQSYELYIPDSVPATGPAPICYGFDPGGNGKSTLLYLAAAAAANGWILAVSNNAMNGAWSTIFTAQDAVLADTEARLNLSATRRFATGLSGGARMSLALAFRYPAKICGTLLLAAGWPTDTGLEPSTDTLNVYIIIGTQDSNYTYDIPNTQGQLVDYGVRCVVQTFNGGHVWPSADMIMAGCRWLNQNAEVDPNAGLTPAVCPAHSLFCQPPSPLGGAWYSTVSDTTAEQSLIDNFQGVALPIATVDWWGFTASLNSGSYWIPADPPSNQFIISLHPNNGGVPGTAVHQETVTATRDDLPLLYKRNFPLRHYHATLSAPVSLISGWVRIQQVGNGAQYLLLLDSPTGDGQCLLHYDGFEENETLDRNLAVSLKTEDMTVGISAAPGMGKPPLAVQFAGSVTGNVLDIVNWRWEFGDGDIVEGRDESSPVHLYEEEGSYTVTLTVSTDLSSSSVTRRDFIVVSETVPLATPGAVGALLAAFIVVGGIAVRLRCRPV